MRLAALCLALCGAVTLGASAGAAPRFEPTDGRYTGTYTSGNHGPGKVRLEVEQLRPGLHGVRLRKWSGELTCPDGSSQPVDAPMTAARAGRAFSGYMVVSEPRVKHTFVGRFTATDALKGRIRITEGRGSKRCDTGSIEFEAKLASP